MPAPKPAYVRDVERSYLSELWERRDFARFLAWGNVRSANSSTALGIVWWVVNPLLLGMVYLLIFGVVLQTSRGEPDYIAYLLTGMFVFYYTRQSVSSGATSVVGNIRLLSNLNMPKLVMPIASLIQAMVGFGFSLVVVFVVSAIYSDIYPTVQVFYLVPAFLIQTIMNLGLATLFGRIAVRMRDITNIIPYLLRIWLYLSPIIWPLSFFEQLEPRLQAIFKLNPLFNVIGMYRSAILGYPIEMEHLVASTIWAVAVAAVGLTVFIKSERTMLRGL